MITNELRCTAIITPFDNYVNAKADWRKQHPTAQITEELKQMYLADLDTPRTIGGIIAPAMAPQKVLMIIWAIVYTERIKQEQKILQLPQSLKEPTMPTEQDL